MQAGKLRHTVVVQVATESRTAHGGVSKSWATSSTVRGEIVPISGREVEVARQFDARISHRVRMRYLSTLTKANRLYVDSARTFNIAAVVHDEAKNRFTDVYCIEDV